MNKNQRESQFASTVVTAAGFIMYYYILNPNALERHRELVNEYWNRVLHRISIWQARQEIAALDDSGIEPVVTVVTGHK